MSGYIVAGIILAIVVMFIIKGIIDEKKADEQLIKALENGWGKDSDREYSDEDRKNISAYYNYTKEDNDIDNITWNDINMDEIYKKVNHTKSAIGSEYLYALLHRQIFDDEELSERNRIIEYFQENKDQSLRLQYCLSRIGSKNKISVYERLEKISDLPNVNVYKAMIMPVLLMVLIIMCFIHPALAIIPTVVVAIVNMVNYYRKKSGIDKYYALFAYIVNICYFIEKLSESDIQGIDSYLKKLHKLTSEFKAFCRGSYIVTGGRNMSGNILDALFDYLKILFNLDIIKFYSMAAIAVKEKDKLMQIYDITGFLDAMVSTASYRSGLDGYCVPEFDKLTELKVSNIYHPLLLKPVKNSMSIDKSMIITGSNASGKSTFIRTVAVNMILAQSLCTALADKFSATHYRVYSSIALSDNILTGDSYYMVEIKSIKRILDILDKSDVPVMVFIDEVLRGTNTLERIAASSQILMYIARHNGKCIAATHDMELAAMLKKEYKDYYFSEKVNDDDVIFDYMLHDGTSTTSNAIKLLGLYGYDKAIIDNARKSINDFKINNTWNQVL